MIEPFEEDDFLKISIQAEPPDSKVIHELLSPWNVTFTDATVAEVTIVHSKKKTKTIQEAKTVIIPLDHSGSEKIKTDENTAVLKVDIVKEYYKALNETFNAKSSTVYRIFTGLPIPYKIAPRQLRDLLMNTRVQETGNKKNLDYDEKLPLDALRLTLVSAIEELVKEKLPKKTWNGKKCACALTHDIDSSQGLRRAHSLKRIEERYDFPSAWYVPSDHFRLDIQTIRELANHGEIGSHDTKHDGKLAQFSQEKLVRRLYESKQALSKAAKCSVEGFRAPLLQHSFKIINALRVTGYSYDTSIPTWEPKHPSTMSPHGIGTVYPMMLNGIMDLPVTLPQDHQMIHVLGMNSKETVKIWTYLMSIIREMGGLCVFLIHPDYELALSENLTVYEELLNFIEGEHDVWTTLPKSIVNLAPDPNSTFGDCQCLHGKGRVY
jgi:hypothetical protein